MSKKGGHVSLFFFGSVAETRLSLLPQPTQQTALEDRATSPVSPDQENLEEGLNIWCKNSHASSPGLFIQAAILDELTSYQGRLVRQLEGKIHFTSRCQIIPFWVHINVSARPKSKLCHWSVNLCVFHPASINSQMRSVGLHKIANFRETKASILRVIFHRNLHTTHQARAILT